MLHSSTFAGSPLAAAAVPAALDAIRDEDVIPRARDLGERLLDLVSGLASEHLPGVVKEVRGRGLLIGIEFHDPSAAAELVVELQLRKVILSHSMHAHETVRMTPPVGLTDEDLDFIQNAFVGAAEQVARTYAGMAGSRS
jgi:putrescine aminotransferase